MIEQVAESGSDSESLKQPLSSSEPYPSEKELAVGVWDEGMCSGELEGCC